MGQMDEFYKGAELGLRVSDQRARHTNLAERAAQTNRQLDISERQADVNMSRLNLLNKQLDYDYTQQKNDDNETTFQLDALKTYKEQLANAANAEGFTKLPQPPAGLHGTHQQDAFRAHQGYLTSRQNDRDYKRHVADVDDKNDLIDNHGLPADWQAREPLARDAILDRAQKSRAITTATKIAYEMGVREADLQDIRLEHFFNPDTGKLDEDSFRYAIQPRSTLIMTSQTTHPTGGASKTYTSKAVIEEKRQFANAKDASDHYTRVLSSMQKMKAELMSDTGDALSEQEADARVAQIYKPDDYIKNTDGSRTPLYRGQQITDRGIVYVYMGGPVDKDSSWKKLR